MSRWEFAVEQDGMVVASGEAPTEAGAKREAAHYAMMYSQDGPVKVSIKEVQGTPTLPRGGKAQDEDRWAIWAAKNEDGAIIGAAGNLGGLDVPEIPQEIYDFQKIMADAERLTGVPPSAFEGRENRTYDGILRMEESKHGVEAGGSAGEDRRTAEAVSKSDDGVESGAVGVGEQKGVDG